MEEKNTKMGVIRIPSVSSGTSTSAVPGQDSSSSEDSSYDSDYYCEASEDSSLHCDVSRTSSDTLAQEFNEYVSTDIKEEEEQDARKIIDSNNYTAKVEFARKLGYTEDQVKIALGKLGYSATQNELLAELIQLDIGSSSSSGATGLNNPSILVQPAESVTKLRHIIIDGSNVAMSHGSNKIFSSQGIKIAVDYFRSRGHKDITVFVPMYRKEASVDDPVSDPKILSELESEGILVWTPSKKINNRRMVCYDDRYIVKLAAETDGIVVSNDNYRDLAAESPEFKKVVEERTLMYSFVNDRFMPPEDPLGRHGPTLDQFLQCNTTARTIKQIPCPYGRKCTYGIKCKYYHTTQKVSVSEALRKQAAMKTTSLPIFQSQKDTNLAKMACHRTKSAVIHSSSLQLPSSCGPDSLGPSSPTKSLLTSSHSCGSPMSGISSNGNSSNSNVGNNGHRKLQRVHSVNPSSLPPFAGNNTSSSQGKSSSDRLQLPCEEPRTQVFRNLSAIFPEDRVRHVMTRFPHEKDPQVICRLILDIFK